MSFVNKIIKGWKCIAIGLIGSSVLISLSWIAYTTLVSANKYSVQKAAQTLSYENYSDAVETYVIYYTAQVPVVYVSDRK